MKIGSEVLRAEAGALVPMSAGLVARPARLCTFVEIQEGVNWALSVEHAVACQSRYWGGNSNMVVPMFAGLATSELFWRLLMTYDPDLVGIHTPSTRDAGEIVPEQQAEVVATIRAGWEQNGVANVDELIERDVQTSAFWETEIPDDLLAQITKWVSPLHHDGQPRLVVVNGQPEAPHELTDAIDSVAEEASFVSRRVSGDPFGQLALTSELGRFTDGAVVSLRARGVHVEQVVIDNPAELARRVGAGDGSTVPWHLTAWNNSLAFRVGRRFFDEPTVVVGDHPEDWLLYYGLRVLRPNVFWIPESKLEVDSYLSAFRGAISRASRSTAPESVPVISAASDEASRRLVDDHAASFATDGVQLVLADWRERVPRGAFWPVDPRSFRNASLLVVDGQTDELPTPMPVSIEPSDRTSNGWMVDVDVRDWSTFRHPWLAPGVLPGGFESTFDQRIGRGGASYFGLAGFIQSGLGIENALSRRRLAPTNVLDALQRVLARDGWSVALSDKGAYTNRTSQLFGGVEKAVDALRNPAVRALLDAYLVGANEASAGGCFLKDTRRRYLSLSEAAAVVAAAAPAGAEADAGQIVNQLNDLGVLSRGHALKCVECRATSFYVLTERQTFTCRRCRREQRATISSWLVGDEPAFRYELHESVFQFLSHHCDLPLLAAFTYFAIELAADDQRALDLGFEIEVFSPDGEKSEHDVVAVWGSDLWLGEATMKDALEESGDRDLARIERLKSVADLLAVRGVLFASAAEFRASTRGRIAWTFSAWPRSEVVVREQIQLRA